jgi:hypothetical protein
MTAGCGHACAISGAVMHYGYSFANSYGFHSTRVLATGAAYRNGHGASGPFLALKNALPGAPPNRPGAFGLLRY